MKYVFLAALLVVGAACAHTVTLNLAYNFGDRNSTLFFNNTVYSANIIGQNVALLLHLDNSTFDASFYGNHGTAQGVDCSDTVGAVNVACLLENSYIEVGHSDRWNSQNLTAAFWVNFQEIKNTVFIQHQSGASSGGFVLGFTAPGTITASPDGSASASVSWTPQTGVWYHIAFTRNEQTNYWEFYVDGESIGSYSINQEIANVTGILKIGQRHDGSNSLNGTIDEIVVFDKSLNLLEINNLYLYGISESFKSEENSKYLTASKDRTVAALVAAGTLRNSSLNNSYNASLYSFQMTQDERKNRFLFAVTNGTYSDIEGKINIVDNLKMISSTFGRFAEKIPETFNVFIRIEYDDIDLVSRIVWSGIGSIQIKNNGKTARNLTNITMEVVR